MLLKNNVGTLSTDKSYSWFTAGCFLTTKHSNTLTEHANEGLHAPFAIGDLPSVASPTCCPRAWQPFLPTPCSTSHGSKPPSYPCGVELLPNFFTCHNWFSLGGGMSSPRGRCSSPHSSSHTPRRWARLSFLQCKSPLLWLQVCSPQHPRLMKPSGRCVMLWFSHSVADPCVLVTAFSPSITNFLFFF